jgi:hypothetical protein
VYLFYVDESGNLDVKNQVAIEKAPADRGLKMKFGGANPIELTYSTEPITT